MADMQHFSKVVKKYGFKYFVWKCLNKIGLDKNNNARKCIEHFYLSLSEEDGEKELKEWFMEKVGYPLDLENPKTFDEKIQWLKLYDSTPIKTRLADKWLVREWVKDMIGEKYLIPIYGVWDSSEEIDFAKLPDKFVLKSNCGMGMNVIVKDKNNLDLRKLRKYVNGWSKINYGLDSRQEWHYQNTPRKIMAEKLLEMGSDCPPDYKVYCFGGKPTYIQMIEGRFGVTRQAFFDTGWNMAGFTNAHFAKMATCPPKPMQLEEMLRLSAKLSANFAFVRVDWYLIGEPEIYFGEMTFTPASGVQKWEPFDADEYLGTLLELPKGKFIVR